MTCKGPGRNDTWMHGAVVLASLVIFFVLHPLPSSGESSPLSSLFWSQDTALSRLTSIFQELEDKGPDPGVVEELENFVETYPSAEVTDEALIRLARIYLDEKNFDKAMVYYQRIIEDFPLSRFKEEAFYGLGYCKYRKGKIRDAKELLEVVLASTRTTLSLRVKTQKLLHDIESVLEVYDADFGDLDTIGIGALLPLKGRYAPFGERALKGILLAAKVFEQGTGTAVEVHVRDTSTDGQSLENAVIDMAYNEHIAGIVGPLLSATADKVAREAQQKRIPIIALSQKEGIPETGDYVFRNFLTPQQQAAAIARYAVEEMGAERFAVMYPENRYGKTLARLFVSEVISRGGEVVGEVSYKNGQRDFGRELKFLFGIEMSERLEGRRRIREYKPTIEADALYIPDYYDTISLIAPYLNYYNIKDVKLLGSNGWNYKRLVELADGYVEGAVFVDGFFSESRRPATESFVERFRRVYGKTPGVLEAQAYDAAMILISSIWTEDGIVDRDAVKSRIGSTWNYEGATGDITFDTNGEAEKELFLLAVKQGRIVELDEEELTDTTVEDTPEAAQPNASGPPGF